jgi:hypothetical protein
VLGNLVLRTIVANAIVKHQLHVSGEFMDVVVDIEGQLLLYCAEIHGLVDDIEVIIDSVLAGVHGFVEEVPTFGFPAHREYLLRSLHP